MFSRLSSIFVLGIAAIALGGIAPDSPLSFVTAAQAKSEKSGGNGGSGSERGGKSGGGKSEKSGNGGARAGSSGSAGKNFSGSAKASTARSTGNKTTRTAASAPTAKARKPAEEQEVEVASVDNPGQFASELKGLNAYHASAQAWENASPNSRVGRIAAYRDAALATTESGRLAEEAAATVTETQDARDGLQQEIAELESDYAAKNAEIDGKIATLDPDAEDYNAQVAALEAERPSTTGYEAQKSALEGQLAAAEVDLSNSQADLAEAEAAAGTAAQTEEQALMAATDGRVLSDEALAYFREKIGLDTP